VELKEDDKGYVIQSLYSVKLKYYKVQTLY